MYYSPRELNLLIAGIILFFIIAILLYYQINRVNKITNLKIYEFRDSHEFKTEIEDYRKKQINANNIRLKSLKEDLEEKWIKESIARSESVTKGKVIEHFAPFLASGLMDPFTTVFIGSPIDIITFKQNPDGEISSIDFFEIKTGSSYLSNRQKRIKNAINNGRVYYKSVSLD